MKSRATFANHPLHPMFVSFPIAFYTAAVVGFITYAVNADPFWFRLALYANIAGVVMGVIAAIPGVIDLFSVTTQNTAARKTGLTHALFNVAGLLLFTVNIWAQYSKWDYTQPAGVGALTLSVIGLVCTYAAAYYGWELVQKHHIGVDVGFEETVFEPKETTHRIYPQPRARRAASDREL